jgi:alpha-tubulin suppressor-like RCC1 family protein
MLKHSFAKLSALGGATVMVLAATALFQVGGSPSAVAAGSSVRLFAWGDNSADELGDGISGGTSDTPVVVALPPGVTPTAFAGGGGGGDPQPSQYAAYAIGSDGKLYAWGDNTSGELGDGVTGGTSSTPVVVSLPAGVTPTAISAGQGQAYAIGSDGKLYAWGNNVYGNLGDGNTSNSDVPVVVSLPSGVTPTAIAAGFESAYAIGSDGKLYAWGDNFYGELGTATTDTTNDMPVVVGLPSGVTAKSIAGGGGAAYAIGSDGNLYAWGFNTYGQLGDDGTDNSTTPVLVALPAGVTATAITGGGGFAHAIGSNGALYGWGLGSSGQLGVGSGSLTPVVVPLAPSVTPKAIADNLHTGYALGSDGNIYAWGYGLQGELGDGDFTDNSPPVVVSLPAGSVVESLSPEPGSSAGYAVVSAPNVAPSITTEPTSQSVVSSENATFTAGANGLPVPTIQWKVSTNGGASFTSVSGATDDTLTISSTTTSENGNEYEAVFTNSEGSATTNPATLTVTPAVAPSITSEPANQSVAPGSIATFSAAASGTPTPTVVWQVSYDGGGTWSNIVGNSSTTSTTLSGVIFGSFENGWQVRAVFTNAAGSATSSPATLTVLPPSAPVITLEPTGETVLPGALASFSAGASGSPVPTVVWQVSYDGGGTWSNIVGNSTTTSTTLSGIIFATFENGWQVRAIFTNSSGSATTTPATLTVP